MTEELSEKHESLWRLAASPGIWAAHFLICYCTAAIWCAKYAAPDDPLTPVRIAIAVITAVGLVSVGLIGWAGYRRHRLFDEPLPHDADTAGDRHRFLGFATALLSGLSAIAMLYAAMTIVFVRSCR